MVQWLILNSENQLQGALRLPADLSAIRGDRACGLESGEETTLIRFRWLRQGPGPSSILGDGDRYFLVHHFFDEENSEPPTLQVRSLVWDERGWQLAGEPYDGMYPVVDSSQTSDLTATWAVSNHLWMQETKLMANGHLEEADQGLLGDYDGCLAQGTWQQAGATTLLERSERRNWIDSLVVPTRGSWFGGRTAYRDGSGGLTRGVRRSRGDADG